VVRIRRRDINRLAAEPDAAPREPPDLPLRAFDIAAQFNLKWIYDAFYVALADMIGCDLWTADARLHEAVRGVHSNVRLLTNFVDAP
jgi:predicted nucleic acid-binding protein